MKYEWLFTVLTVVMLVTALGSGFNLLVCVEELKQPNPVLRGSVWSIPVICGYGNPFFIGFWLSASAVLLWATFDIMKPPTAGRTLNWQIQGLSLVFCCAVSAAWASGLIDHHTWVPLAASGIISLLTAGIYDQVVLARKKS